MEFGDATIPAKELFERDLVLEIRGSKLERRRAKKYAEGVPCVRWWSLLQKGVENDGLISYQFIILDQDEPQRFPCREINLVQACICNDLCPFCSVKEEETFLTSAAKTFLPFQSAAIGSVQVLWHNGLGCLLRNVTPTLSLLSWLLLTSIFKIAHCRTTKDVLSTSFKWPVVGCDDVWCAFVSVSSSQS